MTARGTTESTAADAGSPADPTTPRRVAVASAVGTTIEYYDFFAFATASALVFGTQFFTPLSPASGSLAALASFGVGFLARPLGGVVWGHLGDRVGRRAMLVSSLVLMGASTVAIGLLPTYASIGVAAPIALVVLRLLQGVSLGGEWGGAAIMAVEHAPADRRGRFGSYCQMGTPAGMILALLTFGAASAALTDEQFTSWGWRIPFLVSIVLVALGLWLRLGVGESPEFRRLRDRGERSRRPVRDVARRAPGRVLLAAASFLAHLTVGNIFLVYLTTYGTTVLGLPRGTMLGAVAVGAVAFLVSVPVAGLASDRWGRRPVYLVGSVLLILWAIPFFVLVDARTPGLLGVAVIVVGAGLGATSGAQPAMFAELFDTATRYSGMSVAYSLGAVVGGGLAPVAAAGLQTATGTSLAVSFYMVGVGVISLIALLAIGETDPRRRASRASRSSAG